MKLYSTRKNSPLVSFREALFAGQAPDGGLYLPRQFPVLNRDWYKKFHASPYSELAFYVLDQLVGDEYAAGGLERVISKAYTFSPRLVSLNENLYVLELFHGPTLSFKDFGAQFMAKSMGHFIESEDRQLTILVATSGDTGSAVAHAYHNVEGIRIVLLYPADKVSKTQEMQFTTLGDNITALRVAGTFDDCQAMVKTAFRDKELNKKLPMSSANSINIGRLLPQSVYYFWAAAQLREKTGKKPVICVPSGNFGNICAGMIGNLSGDYAEKFIAAVNANHVISDYIETGVYKPRPSVSTLSNAMDVGRPSNWERIQTLFDNDYERITELMWSTSVSDADTRARMKWTYESFAYMADPHTAVGLEAAERFSQKIKNHEQPILVLSTAHPAKFHEIVEETLGQPVQLAPALQDSLKRKNLALDLNNDYDDLKQLLWYSD